MTQPKRGSNMPGLPGIPRTSNRIRGQPPSPIPVLATGEQETATTPQVEPPNPSTNHQDKDDSVRDIAPDIEQITVSSNPPDYPNTYYDPDPLPASASDAQLSTYSKRLHEMGVSTLETYKELELTGEELWIEFISVFRPHTIKSWDHLLLTRWINLFRMNDVYVERGRSCDKAQKLVDLLFRKDHIGSDGSEDDDTPPLSLNTYNENPKPPHMLRTNTDHDD